MALVDLTQFKTASIAGTVFNDANHNGIKDSGETGMAGVRVYLDHASSSPLRPNALDAMTRVLTEAYGMLVRSRPPAVVTGAHPLCTW